MSHLTSCATDKIGQQQKYKEMMKTLAALYFVVLYTSGNVIALSGRIDQGQQPRRVQGSNGDPLTVFSFSPTPTVSSDSNGKSQTKGKGGSKSETKGSMSMGMKRAKKNKLPKTSKSERRSEAYSKVKKEVGIKGKDSIYAGKGGMDRTSFSIAVPTTAPITDTLQPTGPSSTMNPSDSSAPTLSMTPTFVLSTVPSDVPSMTKSDAPSSTPIVTPPRVTRAPTTLIGVAEEPTTSTDDGEAPSAAPVDLRGGGPAPGRRRGRLIGGIVGGIAGALVVGGGAAVAVSARAARRAPAAE